MHASKQREEPRNLVKCLESRINVDVDQRGVLLHVGALELIERWSLTAHCRFNQGQIVRRDIFSGTGFPELPKRRVSSGAISRRRLNQPQEAQARPTTEC